MHGKEGSTAGSGATTIYGWVHLGEARYRSRQDSRGWEFASGECGDVAGFEVTRTGMITEGAEIEAHTE